MVKSSTIFVIANPADPKNPKVAKDSADARQFDVEWDRGHQDPDPQNNVTPGNGAPEPGQYAVAGIVHFFPNHVTLKAKKIYRFPNPTTPFDKELSPPIPYFHTPAKPGLTDDS